ncbi:hypothetical protein M9978_19425 [Sphingomonas sp. MG17]|uniref:Uncharacterized protein n=1 Tax=Sphingomonas tagetis TaxID=2949092 RepID=A0A9X2HNL4_9SPHN|nr:hypothetical protein [Sphingomonas tagetis]MCP3732599.1 hypothetical protein [Sphingomonas tagetis]
MIEFQPTLYLRQSCASCLELAAFLAEGGLFDHFIIQDLWPGDENEGAIDPEPTTIIPPPDFPAAQVAPGEVLIGCDAIIAHYAQRRGLNPDGMPYYQYVQRGPVRRMREQAARRGEPDGALGTSGKERKTRTDRRRNGGRLSRLRHRLAVGDPA